MAEIIPAILPKDYEDLKNKLSLVRGHAATVQLDVCDGRFVQNTSWPFDRGDFDPHFNKILNEDEGLPFWEDIDFELDLMVAQAVENFDLYVKLGPKRLVFHIEAVGDPDEFREFLEGVDPYVRDTVELGIAVNLDTPLENIFPLIPAASFVQVMGIAEIGFQGQDFDPRSIEYVRAIKEKFPHVVVSVDGGVNLNNAPELIAAGAERLIIGSAIFGTTDIIGIIEEFENL